MHQYPYQLPFVSIYRRAEGDNDGNIEQFIFLLESEFNSKIDLDRTKEFHDIHLIIYHVHVLPNWRQRLCRDSNTYFSILSKEASNFLACDSSFFNLPMYLFFSTCSIAIFNSSMFLLLMAAFISKIERKYCKNLNHTLDMIFLFPLWLFLYLLLPYRIPQAFLQFVCLESPFFPLPVFFYRLDFEIFQ